MSLPEDHPLRKDLPSLGHETALWLQAMRLLRLRLLKRRLDAPLTAFLERWMPRETASETLPEVFELVLEDHLLTSGSAPALADPRWQALLRLPALRAFWVAELRASHHAHLLKMIPHVWLMDETPLPPGSVIAGLGIPDWSHLPRLAGTGRRFRECGMENKDRALIEIQPGQTGRVLARYERQGERIVLAGAAVG